MQESSWELAERECRKPRKHRSIAQCTHSRPPLQCMICFTHTSLPPSSAVARILCTTALACGAACFAKPWFRSAVAGIPCDPPLHVHSATCTQLVSLDPRFATRPSRPSIRFRFGFRPGWFRVRWDGERAVVRTRPTDRRDVCAHRRWACKDCCRSCETLRVPNT